LAKKKRSAKQLANDKKLGQRAKKRSTKKGDIRKTARKAYVKKFKGSKRKPNKPKKKSNNTLKLKSIASSGTLKKVALGVGGAAIATAVISAIAPNSSLGKYAAAGGAYVMGGIEGIIGSMALSMLSRPTGNANMSPAMEVL